MSDFSFDIKTRESKDAPFIVIYGPAGVGKTTFAANSKNNVVLQTEQGSGELKLRTLKDGVFSSFNEFLSALRYVYANSEEIDTVVIDSIDHLEPLVWAQVCEDKGWDSIESPGYGKGYLEADRYWQRVVRAMNKLRSDKNITIVAIAHDIVRVVNDPTAEPYDAHDFKLHKRAVALWKENADVIGLIRNPVSVDQKTGKVKGGVTPTLYTRPSAAYIAKSRYTKMPAMMPVKLDTGWDNFAKFIPALQDGIVDKVDDAQENGEDA